MQVRPRHRGGMPWTTRRLSKKKEHSVVTGRTEKGNQTLERLETAELLVLRRSVVSDSLWPHGLQPTRLLCLFYGIFQAKDWSGLPFPNSRGSSQPRDRTHVSCVSCTGRRILCHCVTGKVNKHRGRGSQKAKMKMWRCLDLQRRKALRRAGRTPGPGRLN